MTKAKKNPAKLLGAGKEYEAKKKAVQAEKEQPLKINGSSANVIGVAMGKNQEKKEEKK